jgi:hypothetical protein
MPKFFAALLAALALCTAHSQAHPIAPAPFQTTAARDAAVTGLARRIYAQMRVGKVDAALLTPEMNKTLTPEALAKTRPVFEQLGDPTDLTLLKREAVRAGMQYEYLADFALAQLHVTIVVTPEGKVGGYDVVL